MTGRPLAAQQHPQAVAEQARHDVAQLADPAFAGRGYLGGGHHTAANYLAQQFRSLGLDSLAQGYAHPFTIQTDVFLHAPTLSVDGHPLQLGIDFLPFPSSPSGQVIQHRALLAGGDGFVFPPRQINAYGPHDPRGKIVIIREALSPAIQQDPDIPVAYKTLPGRLSIATMLGASGVIVLVDKLMYGATRYNAEVPVMQIRTTRWPQEARSLSFTLQAEQDRPFTTQNLIGILPGTMPDAPMMMVMAHYDHFGQLGPAFHFPGANDNASGVAMLLALTRHFRTHPLPVTLVFVAFSGEEIGLEGSRHFVEHPPIDLEQIRFVLNYDMVASGEQGLVAVGGSDYPEPYALLDSLNRAHEGIPLRPRKNAPNSDHYFFLERGIPGFYLYTDKGGQPYHHVDDIPATLEWDDFMQVYQLSTAFITALAQPTP